MGLPWNGIHWLQNPEGDSRVQKGVWRQIPQGISVVQNEEKLFNVVVREV